MYSLEANFKKEAMINTIISRSVKCFTIFFHRFVCCLASILMIVLIIASFLKFASSEYIEGSIILFVVIVNGLVSYWQERKAEESLNGLKQLMGQEAIVLSNGMQVKIPAKELVKGDVIVLASDSPVKIDSSTSRSCTSINRTSAGTTSPARKTMTSPFTSSFAGIFTCIPFDSTIASCPISCFKPFNDS